MPETLDEAIKFHFASFFASPQNLVPAQRETLETILAFQNVTQISNYFASLDAYKNRAFPFLAAFWHPLFLDGSFPLESMVKDLQQLRFGLRVTPLGLKALKIAASHRSLAASLTHNRFYLPKTIQYMLMGFEEDKQVDLTLETYDVSLKAQLARRSDLVPEIAEILSRSLNDQVRLAVSSQKSLSEETRMRLAHDESSEIRNRVARVEAGPDQLFELLANDSSYMVRKSVANNSAAPAEWRSLAGLSIA